MKPREAHAVPGREVEPVFVAVNRLMLCAVVGKDTCHVRHTANAPYVDHERREAQCRLDEIPREAVMGLKIAHEEIRYRNRQGNEQADA